MSDEKINSHKDYSSANPIQISGYSDKIINECKIANIPRPNIKYEFAGFFIEFFAKPIKNIKEMSG